MAKLIIFGTEIELSESDDEYTRESIRTRVQAVAEHHKEIDPVALETAFLDYCLDHGWIDIESGETSYRYFLSEAGERELRRFGMICVA